jgi:prepilin-type processing-associated H-X9-DG protein
MKTSENSQGNRPKVSKLAIASPLVAFIGFFVGLGLAAGPKGHNIIEIIGFYIFILSLLFGLIAGIIAYHRIYKSKGLLTGRAFSILGMIMPLIIIVWIILTTPPDRRYLAYRVICNANLRSLGVAMYTYASDYNKYPTYDKWCDLLMKTANLTEKHFICKGALKNGDKGRCHYAMNPYCEPNSPPDMVLLFETKGGWNQFGGPELLTFENHEGKICNILYNDGHVEFVKPDQIGQLNWNVEK